MSAWLTRLGRPSSFLSPEVSPTLGFQKWHAYDENDDGSPALDTEKSRIGFLEEVALAVEQARLRGYAAWYSRYVEALQVLGLPAVVDWLAGRTLWRMVVGTATNPAMENGLTLHPLHGFPYLPGSAVRGLAHHVAEMEMLATEERCRWAVRDASGLVALPGPQARDRFLQEAEQIKLLFGSLTVELHSGDAERAEKSGDSASRAEAAASDDDEDPAATSRSLLADWLRLKAVRDEKELASRIRRLLDGHTGGALAFYDAVPDPAEAELLEVDLLNSHYPEYYDSNGNAWPSDDQNPRLIHFLAVRSAARFVFPFRLSRWPSEPGRDTAECERLAMCHGLAPAAALALARGWLERGLTTWGAGAKTAAGYGYFVFDETAGNIATSDSVPKAEPRAHRTPQPRTAGRSSRAGFGSGSAIRNAPPPPEPRGAAWDSALRTLTKETAQRDVPLILTAAGQERRAAALRIVQILGQKKFLDPKRGQPWVDDLLRSAGLD